MCIMRAQLEVVAQSNTEGYKVGLAECCTLGPPGHGSGVNNGIRGRGVDFHLPSRAVFIETFQWRVISRCFSPNYIAPRQGRQVFFHLNGHFTKFRRHNGKGGGGILKNVTKLFGAQAPVDRHKYEPPHGGSTAKEHIVETVVGDQGDAVT